MNDTNNNNEQHSLHINSHHPNDDGICNNDNMNVTIAKQLFEAYCKDANEMASSILLSSLSLLSPSLTLSASTIPTESTLQPSSTLTISSITSSTTTLSTTLSTPTSNIQSIIASFIELRSQYIGCIAITHNNNDNINNTNHNTIPNNFSANDTKIFNFSLFYAALLTNSPFIIGAIMPYINYDFTTLNISHDEIDDIKQMNVINNDHDEIYPTNYILQAITESTKQGHFDSIQHLINHYHLSPTIPICDVYYYDIYGCTNLLYYASQYNSPQLIEYFLPLCFTSTNQKVLSQSILNIAAHGHLHLIKQLHNEYNINISQIQDRNNQNILHYAVQSNNIQLIDYLIEDIGLSVNIQFILQHAIKSYKWDIMKHLIIKCNADIERVERVLNIAVNDPTITPDVIDYIITTFNLTGDDITTPTDINSPLYLLASNSNVITLKHVIEKYNVNPHRLFGEDKRKNKSLLYAALDSHNEKKSITQLFEMVKYLLCELGLNVNQRDGFDPTPILLRLDYTRKLQEDRLPIFKLLLEHKAIIHNVDQFLQIATNNQHFSIVQHLIEIYQSSINFNDSKLPDELSPFINILFSSPPIELVTYVLSLNIVDINKPDHRGTTPIQHAMTNEDFNIDIIKLLINNGATVTIDDWLLIFSGLTYISNPYQLFQCLDYFQDTFGWDLETFSSQHPQSSKIPFLQFSHQEFKFRYSRITTEQQYFHKVIIYRTLVHHYKANINDQCLSTNNNTVFHTLATSNHYELIQFTLLHSHLKPNIYLVNNQGETFLHILISNYDQWVIDDGDQDQDVRKSEQQYILSELDGIEDDDDDDFNIIITDDEINDRYVNFEKVLDCIIDLL